ncbi:MAG TPA: hypothetical protein VKG45_03410 [Actinomycetes bacterium]|nr:hypothetical protein [Actinomycetes bacterium]
MTHEARQGIEPLDELPHAADIQATPYGEFLTRHPDAAPGDDLLLRRAVEGGRGQG